MKKLLIPTALALALLPTLAFAAYNDVSLQEGSILSVNGITITVSGSSNVVQSITVDSTTFSFSLAPNSTIKVSAPSGNQLNSTARSTYISEAECKTGSSFTTFVSHTDEVVITVTPSNNACPRTNAPSAGGSASAVVPTTPRVVTPAIAVTTTAGVGVSSGARLATPLTTGSRGTSVKTLQQFLNTHGFAVAASGTGSPGQESDTYGNLTVQAVQKFQKQYGIVTSGTPSTTGFGRVGPKTLTKINELMGK